METNCRVKNSSPYFQTAFDVAEFRQRRHQIAQAIGSGAVAVLQGAPESGAFDVFRQANEFFYLSGVEVPHAYLLIRGTSGESTLYLPRHDPKHERSEGAMLHADEPETVARITGIENIKPLESLKDDLACGSIVFTPFAPAEGRLVCRDTAQHALSSRARDPWDGRESSEQRFRELLQRTCAIKSVRDLSPTLDALRIIKSEAEISVMREAGRLSAIGVMEAMRCSRPGAFEYELATTAEYIFAVHGARGSGYRPIVASGRNIWNAHYYRNNCKLRAGDLVLMDCAPDYCNYTSDIGRMWPVDGTYQPWQRELYGFIVEYHQTLLSKIRPGVTAAQIHQECAAHMAPLIQNMHWTKPSFKHAAEETLRFQGHLSHGVGMAVHDAGNYQTGVLRPGMVFAVDPQMWVKEEALYIRVEDTVVVTEKGVENLTAQAPLELDAVEWMIREAGARGRKTSLLSPAS